MSTSKAKKRPSPFRIKVGCVVALRYKPSSGNHVTMIVPPPPSESAAKPTKYALRSLAGSGAHAEVWTDPIPGRDEGLALIGRRVRCCITRRVADANDKNATATKTKNYIVEGEIVSLHGLDMDSSEWTKQRAIDRRNRRESAGFAVELLVDRDTLSKVPFLERTDEDVDVDKLKKESAKRAYKNEEAIKGKNKVTVKIWLQHPSGIVPDPEAATTNASSQDNIAKWAIRKRIPNQPGQPLELEEPENNGQNTDKTSMENGTGAAAGSGVVQNGTPPTEKKGNGSNNGNSEKENGSKTTTTKKHRKSNGTNNNNAVAVASAPTQFMGNANDDNAQQQRNWRWLAARYFDVYLADAKDDTVPESTTICNKNRLDFYKVYSNLLASCGGFIGEVLEVAPSSRAGTLAMVTLRRIILPEHTVTGRSCENQDFMEAYDDYDSTLIGKRKKSDNEGDGKNGHDDAKASDSQSCVVFRVPIEELVIVSRQIKRDEENDTAANGSPLVGLRINSSYSLSGDCQIRLKNTMPKKLDGEGRDPQPLTKKKLKKLALCHRCRTWLPRSRVTLCENENCLLTKHLNQAEELAASEEDKVGVGWCDACIDLSQKIDSLLGRSTEAPNLPCCTNTCDCRQCSATSDRFLTRDVFSAAIEKDRKAHQFTSGDSASLDNALEAVLVDADATVNSIPVCHFGIPPDFLDIKNLSQCSSKPITKVKPRPPVKTKNRGRSNSSSGAKAPPKRKRDTSPSRKATKKPKGAATRPRSPVPTGSSAPPRLARRQSEDYSVFKPTCCRMVEYKEMASAKAAGSEGFFVARQSTNSSGERIRNIRELQEKNCRLITAEKDKDKKTLTSRAARANQRRLVKDVALLGGASFNFDTLAGRESQLRFDRSNIHAWGVFADGEISSGDVIAEYRGELIGNAMAEKREKEYEQAKIGSDYMFRIDGLCVCDATKQGNVARFINASCDPNCYTKIITLDGKQRIVIYAKKDIKAGEELCYDYKFSLEYDPSERIPCHCGAPDCRGFMNWDKKLGRS
ncbi:lysine N-methyltransferase, H3 lysine-4 specific [Seminavis robusta]|uniref:[histone H3]-lysine(4) N-trimethyltransferase n=1 Tax=Seminavis robusta TaxID=568900 RepID=A0A9N8DAZ5_9STRA|nr:lysine N-methyltransferase, H3 lysine-4 specific [Seminavis robusta]|eukprot:Sro59_g034120.1 lysine N-methyltransferase, H3 lysine-4 specific (1027) ;mRNA; r:47940-51086